MKIMNSLAVAALLTSTAPAFAVVCSNNLGVVTDVVYDLTNVFTNVNNNVGEIVTLAEKSQPVGVWARCAQDVSNAGWTYRSYVTDLPIQETIGTFRYVKLNDHLNGSLQITDNISGTFYPPQNYVQMGSSSNVLNGQSFPVNDSNLVFRLKVTKRFVGSVSIPKQTMFKVFVTTTNSDPLTTRPVYTISYSGQVDVPQSCEINAGQIVEFDFGDIGAALFSQAGAGNRPQSVTPQSKTVGIKCSNINSQAYLSLSLETANTAGNIMVSDNNDLGFIVSDGSGMPLTPNNANSKISYHLDDTGAAQVNIRAWPVSVTGNTPSIGPFTARGYLKVNYD